MCAECRSNVECYIQRFVVFLLYICVSVCFVTTVCGRPPATIFDQRGFQVCPCLDPLVIVLFSLC